MDAAERWLAAGDPDYAATSRTWRHVSSGDYKCPRQEVPWGLSGDLATLVESGGGQYVEHADHRACGQCGAAYQPTTARHKFCSGRCQDRSRPPRDRADYMRSYRANRGDDTDEMPAVLYDHGAGLPQGHPFAQRRNT